MPKKHLNTTALNRSLVQKAVRRGDEDLIYAAAAYLRRHFDDKPAEFARLVAGITFEECWPLGAELAFNRRYHSKVAALVKLSRAVKIRDALGLGFLAHTLARRRQSVLCGDAGDRDIKIIANAIRRPDDFWEWIEGWAERPLSRNVVGNVSMFKSKGSSIERAVGCAAAYLAGTAIPGTGLLDTAPPSHATFPYWVVFDHHTAHGRRALRDVARDLHMPVAQLAWCCFYFEGGRTNGSAHSVWWDRMCRWYFNAVALPEEEARLLWDPAKPQIKAALAEEAGRLQGEIYSWKLSHADEALQLKREVQMFLENIHRARAGPETIF
jgi:hypothetical protein